MPTKPKSSEPISLQDEAVLNRIRRTEDFFHEGTAPKSATTARRVTTREPAPVPSRQLSATWRSSSEVQIPVQDASKPVDPKSIKGKLRNTADYTGTYHKFSGAIRPEYDMLEPFVIYDTEVFVRQAVSRKLALMFRNGFEIVSDLDGEQGQRNVEYIQRRFDAMEYVTGQTTENFLRDVLYNLLLCSNCILRKLRKEDASPGVRNKNNEDREPIAAYVLIPPHEIQPILKEGVIQKWRRYYTNGALYEEYQPHDIVHLRWDKKIGHIFGTPRTQGVRDDIFALRRLEENIELLFVNHLFPLFHVQIGNEKNPCWYGANGESEIDIIKYQIETMPKEGVFVTDERVKVDVVGAEGKGLDTKELIAHLKSRVLTGLGVSPLDVGEGDTANRSTADNISQILKDAIKADLDVFVGLLRMHFFKDWFEEANYSLSILKATTTTQVAFHEIDMDTLIKEENHVIELFNNHLLSEKEARRRLKLKPIKGTENKEDEDRSLLHFDLHILKLVRETEKAKAEAQMKVNEQGHGHNMEQAEQAHGHVMKQNESQISVLEKQGEVEATKATAHAHKAAAQTKLTHAKTKHALAVQKATPGGKSVGNKNRPANQHGRALGPTRAKSAQEFRAVLVDKLATARETLIASQDETKASWHTLSRQAVEESVREVYLAGIDVQDENSYTNQLRMGQERLQNLVGLTRDPEILAVLLDEAGDFFDEVEYVGAEVESDSPNRAGQPAGAGINESPVGGSDLESEPGEADNQQPAPPAAD